MQLSPASARYQPCGAYESPAASPCVTALGTAPPRRLPHSGVHRIQMLQLVSMVRVVEAPDLAHNRLSRLAALQARYRARGRAPAQQEIDFN